ncbi:MAG TPA: RHO alpha subunit C-terminal catalytic domain-containing protein, partial [Sphingomonadales bacterium]
LMMGGLPAHSSHQTDIPQAPLTDMLRFWGLDPADFEGRAREARRALQQAKRKLGPARGFKHYETLSDEQLTDYYHYTLFPNVSLTMSSDGWQVLRPEPHPTDPEKCIFDHWFFVPVVEGQEQVETPIGLLPLEPGEHQVFKHGERSLGFVADQDLSIAVGQQLGLASRSFRDAYLSNQEGRVRRYHEVLNDYLEGRR